MIDRGIAVFSGVHPKVVEQLTPTLRSTGIETVTVTPDPKFAPSYFERLARQTLHVAQKEVANGNVRLTSALISPLFGSELEAETQAFFPAFRRIAIRAEWRNNPSSAKQIATVVQDYFRGETSKSFTRGIAARRDDRLLLPPRNTPSKALLPWFKEIYLSIAQGGDHKFEKEIIVQRGGRGLKVRDLKFLPTNNGERHPVRRCTDTCLCDLKAAFRFGAPVSAKFEFDVTAENKLKSKTFHLCSGMSHEVTSEATHLNMRINDDFKEG